MTKEPSAGTAGAGAGSIAVPPQWLAPTIDYGPLAVFFVAYCFFDILIATGVMVVATVGALGLSLAVTRRIPIVTLITSAMILAFGALTLVLSDESYLKLQSTVISSSFSLVLFAARLFQWPLMRLMFERAFSMNEQGWSSLTLRFALFFAGMAAINEVVARTQSTSIWVDYNVFGQTALSLLFLAAQWRLLNRHASQLEDDRPDQR